METQRKLKYVQLGAACGLRQSMNRPLGSCITKTIISCLKLSNYSISDYLIFNFRLLGQKYLTLFRSIRTILTRILNQKFGGLFPDRKSQQWLRQGGTGRTFLPNPENLKRMGNKFEKDGEQPAPQPAVSLESNGKFKCLLIF